MSSCAVTSVIAKDPRFQSLKEAYKDKHYSDDHLAQGLQLCREYHAYNDDWFPEASAQRSIFTRFMNHYLVNAKLAKTDSNMSRDSVYNLYTTLYGVYTPEQLDNRVNMIARNFRDLVDRLEKNDKRGRSRQEIIKAFGDKDKNGYQKLIEKVFDIYEKNYTDVDKMMDGYVKANPNATEEQKSEARKTFEYRAQEFKTLLANKERLAAIASTRIGEDEGFVVNIKDFQVSFEDPSKEDQLSYGNTEAGENNGEDKEEGSKGDRYGDFRTLKLLNTLSPRARRLISRIPKVDNNGNQVRDDIGVSQYIGGRQVATVLKRVLVNSSPNTMMSDLAAAADFYPWINGLINVLEKNTDEQTTIYANFKNAETTYVYTAFENGRYVHHIANSRSGGYALMREAGNNLRAGYVMDDATSIYTGYGALKSLEEIQKVKAQFEDVRKRIQSAEGAMWIRMVDGDKPLQAKRIEEIIEEGAANGKDLSYLRESPVDAMQGFLRANPDIASKLSSLLRGMGFAVSENDIKTIALQTMKPKGFRFLAGYLGSRSQKGRNKLYQLVEYMGSVYGRAEEIYKKNLPATGQYLYNTTDGFKRINSALALSQYKEVEDRVVNEGKSLSTYNNVNLLHQTFDELMNKQNLSEENYQDYLENEYLQYEGMALGNGDRRQVYGWLKLLQDNAGNIREKLRVIDSAAFNHVEYAELSRGQKLTNSLVMYLEGGHTFQQDDYALYEVPIQADYSTAYNFILAPKFNQEAEVVEALTNEVLIELERIAAIEARQNDVNRVELSVYERQGMKFQIFPEFNDNGFREQYSQIQNADDAFNFVKEQVAKQLTDVISKDFATIEEAKILSNPAMNKVDLGYGNYGSIFSENNRISELNEKAVNALRMYALNVFYARQQMTKLLVGGTEQFNGLIDFEKRNMLTHATRSSLNTNATWNGTRVGRDTQNVVYVEDDESASAFLDDIKEMLHQLLDNKVISESQFNTMIKTYSKIKTTDGQGFRTLDSYRRVQIMSGQWDKEHERAYNAITRGNPTKDDISVFMQNIKPVLTGYETIPAAAGENQKPVKATVLHKYSEAVLLPMALSKYCLQNQSVPLQAFERAQERLKKQGKEIDMFLFHSGVKVGAHSVIQPFAKKDGNRITPDEKSIEDYIFNSVVGKESVMHTLPFKYYGIAASTPAHVADDRIAWASQAEKVAWANILKGQKITVSGKQMDAWDARELYFDIKTANIVESFKQIREFFADSDKLEQVFQEELASKSYSSSELQYALAHLQDGTFAVPLYSPNVEHQVQELLSSIIKKRLTKPKVKGANILQTTGIGMDIEASSFDNNNALSEDQKLKVVFEGTGANKRIKYVDVYMPIHDSRLKMFADKDGNIGPERLKELVDNGIIPETILEFIAYRTPSDAEHSVIPCRIKGFIANTGGATIRMPKEIMVMTGHDYDGDKMRCHFKDFRLVDKEGSELDLSDEDIALMVLGQKAVNPSFRKVEAYEYDYDKPAIENSLKARNNARVELMFSELTSPAGSQRMIIPGGCDETKVIAKSLYLVRAASNDEVKSKIAETLVKQGVDSSKAYSVVRSTTSLYNTLVSKSDKELSDIVREVSSTETPYSVTHSADAFDYIMGGSQMIGIYATYNSALQMLQRLDMNYIPALTKNGKPYTVTLFGNTFDKLFAVNNHNGRLASLGLARLLNAAVDNNKDPVLGYLNQTKEMSELTFLMFAAGMSEEEIHLIMNQPSVIELINRMKARDNKGIVTEIKNLIDELSANSQELGEITPWIALDKIKLMERDDFIRNLASTHESIRTGDDFTTIQQQIYVLQTLRHLEPAANNLATFVRLTRPESESGSIGTSVSDIIAKVTELNKFRNTLALGEDSDIRISGMREILEKRDVNGGWDTSYIEEIIGSKLPEVVALNSLMLDSSLDMFKPLFPQAKDDWVNLAAEIANQYSYKKVQEGTVAKIGQEMILWKLLSNKKFITGNPQEEQKRIIIDVPKNLKDLKQRIAKASQNHGTDAAAEELIGNAFLNNLTTTDPQNSNTAPRLRFSLNGAPVEGTRDLISSSWNAMLSSPDKSIRDLAIDLFKYNLYTNGFSYGMYEFAHFAPFSVLMSTPGYIEALQDVLKSNWNSEEERENFINQYYMNHWGDKKFIPSYNIKALKISSSSAGSLVLSKQGNDEKVISKIKDLRYIVLRSGEKREVQTLYRVTPGASDAEVTLVKAQKLGVRNRSQQMTLQYNPTLNYDEVTPVVPGNDSAWGQLDELNPYAEGNINAEGQRPFNPNPFGIASNPSQPLGLNFFGIKPVATQLQKLEEKAEKEAEKNEGKIPEMPPAPTIQDMPMPMSDAFGLGVMDMSALQGAVARVSNEDSDTTQGKMYSLANLTQEERKIKREAQSDGTFMLAPNGNHTNLTEKQWLQVRTKAFKSWFGDWEKVNQFNLSNIDYSKVDTEEVSKPWRSDPTKNNKTLRIYLKNQHNKGYFELVKDNEFGQYSVHFKTAKSGSKYNSPTAVESTKEERRILFEELVKAIPDGAVVSTWGSLSEDGVKGLSNVGREMTKIGEREVTLKSDGSKIKIPIYQKGAGVSKVVDENGEPLVLYHGTNSVFNAFSLRYFGATDYGDRGAGFYLSKSKEVSSGYGDIIMPVFLNIKTPYNGKADNATYLNRGKEAISIAEKMLNWYNESFERSVKFLIDEQKLLSEHSSLYEAAKIATTDSEDTVRKKLRTVEGYEEKSVNDFLDDLGNINTADGYISDYEVVVYNPNQIKSATDNNGEFSRENDNIYLRIARRDENGNVISENVPATPANISEARKQKTFVELNKRLRDILRSKGIDIGVLTNAEAMMSIGGVADFDTANVTAEGLLELIRIAEGYEGEQALPEEFAHVAIEMLGHEHPLVKRLLAAIENNPEALNEAYGEMYSEYADRYGEDNHDKLVLEAAGKLVAKQLFRQQQIETRPIKRLVQRVIDAIKSLFRKFRREEVQNAIFDANDIASKLAREMLGGKLLDQMSVMNINQSGLFQSVKKDITNKNDILSKLLKNELKRLSILKRREGYRTKDKQSKSITATEMQITKLESAIKNYKTEDAIVTYMSDSLTFLAAMEKSLDDAVNSGRPVNTICKKLNMVRDTLYSFSAAIEAVREAIREGEVQDNIGIEQSLAQVSNVLANFHQKYESYARTYFEEMLSNVYGEHGKTVTIGKDKGRKISIHEMATKADHDISLISRLFNSLADCNDYVLRAIDDVTRDAKLKARRRASALRPRIEVAISELEKATGSRDQSFMFETIKGEDGKIRRTGKYISKKEADKLPEAKRKFYNTMMEIKKEVDQFIPDSLLEDRKIIMLRKYTMDRFKDAEGAKGKALEAWDGLKNRVMDTSDNIDFENYEVAVDFEGNRVDMLPVKFLLKSKKESYDDMTDDVATSMMAYAGMAIEYNELNNVIGILENAKFMASERDVAQKTGNRKQRETISTDNYIFHEQFTKKQALSNAQKALEDFFQMHIYGHIQKNEGTFGNTRISKRKVVDTINMITSYSQMAINIPQRIANVSTGMTQIAIESVGKGVFGAKDVAWASKIYIKESGDRLAETGKTDYDNKLSLWDEYFDVHQNNGRDQTKYKKGRMSRIFNSSLLYAGLTMGEDYLASTTSLAIAHTIKVKSPSGKIETLWDAYEVKYTNPNAKTGAYLSIKDGYTKEDGSPITFEDEKRFAKLSAGMNFELQGIYNLDDRSAVQQYAFGALIIMYRKWIAPALKRRYSGVNYNLLKDDYQEGYHRTMFRFVGEFMMDAKDQVTEEEGAKALLNIVADMKALKTSILLNWNKMNDYEKSNVKRSLTELAIVAGLWISCSLLGKVPPPDYGEDEPGAVLKWFDQTLMSQMLRLRTEIGSQAPTPMFVDEALHLLKSPFAAIAPLQNTINALNLLVPSNYLTEIKSGRYRGHSRAYKYFRELPVISMFKKVDNFLDPSPLISYYKNDVIM